MEYTPFTKDEFYEVTGKALANEIPDGSDEKVITAFIKDVCDDILDFIAEVDCHFDREDISTTQNAILHRAFIIQAKYRIANGDLSAMSGYNAVTGAFTRPEDLKKMFVAQKAKDLLNATIIYRGI